MHLLFFEAVTPGSGAQIKDKNSRIRLCETDGAGRDSTIKTMTVFV